MEGTDPQGEADIRGYGSRGYGSRPRLARARRLVLEYGWNATAYQILNPGIRRWFASAGDAVVGYVPCAGHWVVAGSPVCSRTRLSAVVEELEAAAVAAGRRLCYFAADERLAGALAARGPWDRLYLGAQPSWDPADWPEILASKASLRAQLNRARNKGVEVEAWLPERARGDSDLKRILQEWLATRGLPPLHFLVEPETLGRLYDRRIFVASRDGRPIAFLIATPVPRRRGWLVEQNVRGAKAPNGTTELLLDAAMRMAAGDGASYLTLGLCPLSKRARLEGGEQRLWLRALLGWMRAHGRRFYDFDGLDAYKAKFMPRAWEPIYAITADRRIGLRTLWAITEAFAATAPPLLVVQALARAVRQEWRWLRRSS